ncbi:MAG: M20/M25/M40 family metallo-hydrolase [Pyrinomonadaceae bacterium]
MNIKLRHRPFILLLVSAISVAVLAQQPNQIAPSVERLRAHVTYLASDALEGRRTGTAGANGAAQYIAGEFSRLGLRPGMQNGRAARTRGEAQSRYLQQFPYVAGVELGKSNRLAFSLAEGGPGAATALLITLRVGDDWMPLGLSASTSLTDLPLAFVGYGITASELKHDDYSTVNATSKVAIAFAGTPDTDNPHGQFARYEDVRWKAIAARNAGARGLVVIAREENFKEDRLSRLRYDNTAGDAGLPVVGISRQAAARLLGFNGLTGLAETENRIRKEVSQQATKSEGVAVRTNISFDAVKSTTITISADVVRREVAASNVIGILEGSDPKLKNEAIVIGAHYDHLGLGGEGSLAQSEGQVHHGADDNASGTAGVLELARAFSTQRPKPRRTIVFAAFGGEEEGLLGSNYYVNHPLVPLANTVAMINMDMIGRMKANKLIIGGVGSAQEWREIINSTNASAPGKMNVTATGAPGAQTTTTTTAIEGGQPIVVGANGRTIVSMTYWRPFDLALSEDGYGPSDHSSFYAKQIPVMFFWTGTHEDYHKPSDTAEKIKYEDETRVLSFVAQIVRSVDMNLQRPTYAVAKSESTGRSTGFRVYLGTIPNYADSGEGLLLDGVRDDSPAAKAGLTAGDRIVKLAGRDVRNVYDYTYALGEMKAVRNMKLRLCAAPND